MPTKTKPKADETIFIALFAFAGNDVNVREGARLRRDNPIVTRFPDRFVPEDTPDDELFRLRAVANVPPPPPPPIGRVKLRVLPGIGSEGSRWAGEPQTVSHAGRVYHPGETLEAEGADAQHLLDSGCVEVVRSLRSKRQKQPEPVEAPGIATFNTGRTE